MDDCDNNSTWQGSYLKGHVRRMAFGWPNLRQYNYFIKWRKKRMGKYENLAKKSSGMGRKRNVNSLTFVLQGFASNWEGKPQQG